MAKESAKVYEPASLQEQAAKVWKDGNYFHAEPKGKAGQIGKSYTIVIPPPNVTAALHLGHALNNTLQDILIRFHRMQGFNTLWMPGTDHAGIATQTVVEKRLLAEQGKRRTDFERAEFVGHVQAWKDEYEGRIIGQLQSMGCSCDWDRTRFTMDETCAKAVRATFFKLFKDGLIYRGKRLVNWDPATQTVLADDEVEHQSVQGHFWYLKYPLAETVEIDGQKITHITVATTRPETMLGDTAVAMNPSDPRAKFLVGKMILLPIVGRMIPIIADEHVVLPNPDNDDEKAKFGTGFLKVTPAHDPNDWEIGQRHSLPVINVMAPDGSISDKFGWNDAGTDAEFLLGMDRFEAREAIVDWFRCEKLLESVREYTHEVGHSYRSHVPIEPYLSDQWYVAVKKPIEHLAGTVGSNFIDGTDVPVNSLAGLALKPLIDGRLKFTPDRYAKNYQMWLENLRDWPISRQLWWGHQIPVWTIAFSPAYWENSARQGEANHIETINQEFDKLLNLCKIEKNISQHKSHENHYLFYVCSNDQRADRVLNFLTKLISRKNIQPDPNMSKGMLLQQQKESEAEITKFKAEFGTDAYAQIDQLHRRLIQSCERDPDVLDTWFSSALWPFSTLGWPEQTEELKTYYPGDVLCTAREIITLWVSRMVMMGQYCVGDIPFKDVYIHAMIQDGLGRKMSKSLGNGIDPLAVIDSHGTDAMRFTLASMTTDTQDVRMPVEMLKLPDGREVNTSPKFDVGRNFCNKIWNASRFAMMNLENVEPAKFDAGKLNLDDKWILSKLARTVKEVTEAIEAFKFNEPMSAIYKFFWNDLCDWYLEWIKPRMRDEDQRHIAQNVLAYVFDSVLRLMHPFMPFISEAIFAELRQLVPTINLKGIDEAVPADALVIAKWPVTPASLIDENTEKQIDVVQAVIRSIRDIRSQYNVSPAVKLNAMASGPETACKMLNHNAGMLCKLANLESFTAGVGLEKPARAAAAIANDLNVYVDNVIDPEAERKRLEKLKEQITNQLKGMEAKLNNENYLSKAKPEIVQETRNKFAELKEQLETIEKHIASI